MRMTTKLVSLLTILFVFFKFGEPTKAMMSIYGDKGFLFHSDNLAANDMIGFVYDETDGSFAVVNCSDTVVSSLTLKTDCTVSSAVAVTNTATGTTETEALRAESAPFPETGVNTNMMVARLHATTPIVTKTTANLGAVAAQLIAIVVVVGTSGSETATDAGSTFLCNNLDATNSASFFALVTGTFGALNHVKTQSANYLPIMKCVAAVRDVKTSAAKSAFATFILIVTNHAELTARFSSLAFPSVVLLPQAIKLPTNTSSIVGYINGIDKCPTDGNVTFTASKTLASTATTCKGTISINTSGNYSFSYNGTSYYLPVTDASGATTCPATTTTTCEDFAFNFTYSNTLIGMLLIFMLKMLQSY